MDQPSGSIVSVGQRPRAKEIWLWVAMFPAALVLGIVVQFPIHWLVLGTFKYGDMIELSDGAIVAVERLAVAFFVPLTAIVGGSRIVVRPQRRSAAIALSGATLLFMAVAYIMVLASDRASFDSPTLAACAAALNLAGIGTAIVVRCHPERE